MKLKLDFTNDQFGKRLENSFTLLVFSEDGQNVINVAEGDLDFLRRWAEENYPDLDFPSTIKLQVLDYIGSLDLTPIDVETVADPVCEGVWAARIKVDFHLPDFLVYPDGDIEEVEFTTWPPVVRY